MRREMLAPDAPDRHTSGHRSSYAGTHSERRWAGANGNWCRHPEPRSAGRDRARVSCVPLLAGVDRTGQSRRHGRVQARLRPLCPDGLLPGAGSRRSDFRPASARADVPPGIGHANGALLLPDAGPATCATASAPGPSPVCDRPLAHGDNPIGVDGGVESRAGGRMVVVLLLLLLLGPGPHASPRAFREQRKAPAGADGRRPADRGGGALPLHHRAWRWPGRDPSVRPAVAGRVLVAPGRAHRRDSGRTTRHLPLAPHRVSGVFHPPRLCSSTDAAVRMAVAHSGVRGPQHHHRHHVPAVALVHRCCDGASTGVCGPKVRRGRREREERRGGPYDPRQPVWEQL